IAFELAQSLRHARRLGDELALRDRPAVAVEGGVVERALLPLRRSHLREAIAVDRDAALVEDVGDERLPAPARIELRRLSNEVLPQLLLDVGLIGRRESAATAHALRL